MLKYHKVVILWLALLGVCRSNAAIQFSNFKRSSAVLEGDLRLTGSQKPSEGRVEIYHDGQWGSVCDDGWDLAEAQVVCRQLKFPAAKSVVTGEVYGKASGPIWMDDMECKGNEKYLNTCKFKGWGATDCSHKEDVGVICDTGAVAAMPFSSYSLDHSIVLSDVLGELFDSRTACDLSITAQSSTSNVMQEADVLQTSDTICAHKMILSHAATFNITEDTRNLTVDVVQSCLPHFSSFIRYLYTRKIDVTFSSVQCLHWLASKYGADQLLRDTGLLFTQILPDDDTFETQISIHEYALETKDFVLQENCVQYLAWNFQNFTQTPAWIQTSVDLVSALLVRSDLVVPDEWFVLEAVESWILNNVNSSVDTQVKLISLVRFPMIPAEKLTVIQMASNSLYSTHKNVFNDHILKALQFNFQLLANLKQGTTILNDDVDYQPRIYTSSLWSVSFDSSSQRNYYSSQRHYGGRGSMSIYVPYHSSLIFHDRRITWAANIFVNQYECSNQGTSCPSLPMARLVSQEALYQKGVVFQNRLLLLCQDRYICQVQDFKNNVAFVSNNGTQSLSYPCPNNQFKFIFVVRPGYI